jgi:hypothetical protein
MKLRHAIPIALFLAIPLSSFAQSPTERKFRIEIQKDATFTLTNLSDKTLTACVIQLSVSTDPRLPRVGDQPFPDNVKVVAGIWEDGTTFGDEVWVNTLLHTRADYISAYEQAIAIMKQGIEANWTRQQYLDAINGMRPSQPYYAILRTFEANQALDQHPQTINHLAQLLLDRFQQSLQLLRPQKPAEPTPSASAKS